MSNNDQWASSGRAGLLVVLVAVELFFCAGTAWAQVFRLGTWEGSLEGVSSFTRDDTNTNGQHSRFQDILTEERLNIRNNGAYILDPRIVTLSLGGSVGIFQDHFSFDGDSRTNLGTLWGYDVFASVLPDQPLSLNVFASRDQSVISRELAGRTEGTTETRGATLFARSLYIPSTLTVRQELLDEETRIANVVARRSEQRNIFRYEGRRGWVDSELGLVYEFIDDTDRVIPSFSFRSHDAQGNYTLDFGDELNRHWDSTLRYYTRTGLFETTVWTADESLRVDHTDQLRTDYRYSFIRTDAANGANTTHTAIARLQHRLYESLTTTASLDGVEFSESRMANHLGRPVLLLDITVGPRALAAGLAEAARELGCDAIVLLDVGGDVLAHGNEPGLASPLCDAVVLAAGLFLARSAEVIAAVYGPGCDGELTPDEVLGRVTELQSAGALLGAWGLTPQACDLVESAAEVVPTEASLNAARCARGERGPVPIRGGRRTVQLTPLGALTFFFDPLAAADAAVPLATAVSPAASLEQAHEALTEMGVRTELELERERAAQASD